MPIPNTIILGVVTGFSSGIGYTIDSYLITKSLIKQFEKFENRMAAVRNNRRLKRDDGN